MIEDVFAELRGQFHENTRARISEIRVLVARLRSDQDDRDAITLIHRHFHGLAGLGGTYGHSAISAAGDQGEDLCLAGSFSPPVLDRFDELLGVIERDLDSAGEPPTSGPAEPERF